MKSRRTFKVFAIVVAAYALLTLPGLFWPGYLDTPFGLLVVVPYLSIYLFHGIGIPGLLQHGGACGWGWCAPTLLGWVVLLGFWLGVAWLLVRLIAGRATDDADG